METVVPDSSVEHVRRIIASHIIVQRIPRRIHRIDADKCEILHIPAERVAHRTSNGVQSFVCLFDDAIIGVIDGISVIAPATD